MQDDRATILQAHADGTISAGDAIRALTEIGVNPTREPTQFGSEDDHILGQISATPEAIQEFLLGGDICDYGDLPTTEELCRIGSAMYADPEIWQAHANVLLRALDHVRPDVRLPGKIRKATDSAWTAILRDMADGQVPKDVATFVDLQGHVDANTYLIDAAEEFGIDWGDAEDGPMIHEADDPLIEISNRLDAMLRARVGEPPEGMTADLTTIYGKARELAGIVGEPGLASEIASDLRAILNAERYGEKA